MQSCHGVHVRSLCITMAFGVIAVGCSGSKPDPGSQLQVAPSAGRIPVGTVQFLTASIVDTGGRRSNSHGVHWTSTDPSIITVGSDGMASAIRAGGPVYLVAESDGHRDSASLTAVPRSITSALRLSTAN